MSSYKKFCDCLCCLCVTYLFSCFNSGAYTFINLSGRTYCDSAFEVLAVKIKDIATTSVVTVLQVVTMFQMLDLHSAGEVRNHIVDSAGNLHNRKISREIL